MVGLQLLLWLPLLFSSSFLCRDMADAAATTERLISCPLTDEILRIPYPLFGLDNDIHVQCWAVFNLSGHDLFPPQNGGFYISSRPDNLLETLNMLLDAISVNLLEDIQMIRLDKSSKILTKALDLDGFNSFNFSEDIQLIRLNKSSTILTMALDLDEFNPFNLWGSSASKSCNTAIRVRIGKDFFSQLYPLKVLDTHEFFDEETLFPVVLSWTIRKNTQGEGRKCKGYTFGMVSPVSLQTEAEIHFTFDELHDQSKEGNFSTGEVPWHSIYEKTRMASIPVIGIGFLCLVISLGFWLYQALEVKKKMERRQKLSKQNEILFLEQIVHAVEYNLDQIEEATDKFHKERQIARGGSATVYKGVLSDGRIIAVKKSEDANLIRLFVNEAIILSKINHTNVVKLIGYCKETEVPLLVYEFVINGTLAHHLHELGLRSSLGWGDRLKIAAEVANAIACMHSCKIIHRDIKSTNILLDENFTAKLCDFGLSRTVPSDQDHVSTKELWGTEGYVDPDYIQTGQLTGKSDVYSFGVVLAELLTGEKAVRSQGAGLLAGHFVEIMNKNLLDQNLDARIRADVKKKEVIKIAKLAKGCLRFNPTERPTMQEMAAELQRLMSGFQKANR